MSKLVNWGRWLVAGLLIAQGLASLSGAFTEMISILRSGQGTFYPTYMHLLVAAAIVLCAWGIFRLHRWAYWLALVVCVLELVTLFGLISMTQGPETFTAELFIGDLRFDSVTVLIPVAATIGCLIWLLLPVVRAEYLRRDQIA